MERLLAILLIVLVIALALILTASARTGLWLGAPVYGGRAPAKKTKGLSPSDLEAIQAYVRGTGVDSEGLLRVGKHPVQAVGVLLEAGAHPDLLQDKSGNVVGAQFVLSHHDFSRVLTFLQERFVAADEDRRFVHGLTPAQLRAVIALCSR